MARFTVPFKYPAAGNASAPHTQANFDALSNYLTNTNPSTINTGAMNTLAYYAAAGTTLSSLAAITASRALASDSNGLPTASSATTAELNFLSGVTSSIQPQLNSLSTHISNVGWFNVKDYGAVGDGLADDTVAIQAAITAAEAAYGGMVVFPRGTYLLSDTLRIKHTISMVGLSGTTPGGDSDYSTDAGAPNLYTQGVIIRQHGADKDGLLIRQDPIGTYKIFVILKDLTFIGQLANNGDGPFGNSGDGIKVDPQDPFAEAECYFDNVAISWFRGYGLNLVDGYFGSTFINLNINGSGLTGFRAVGSSQGEYTVINLRSFGNGYKGTTEIDQCGVYVASGGGISFYRLSCTSNYLVHCMIEGATVQIFDFWSESFSSTSTGNRGLVFKNCTPNINGACFSPQSSFTGKIIDMRSGANGQILNVKFFSTVDPSGYHIYEDGSSGSNTFQITALADAIKANLSSFSTYGIANTTNQIFLQNTTASRYINVVATTPASASRVVTVPDPGANANFVLSEAAATINGQKTFGSAPIFSALTASTVPYLDASKVLTSSAVTPTELGYVSGVSSAIQTQLNAKATDSLIVHLAGIETITGAKSFSAVSTFNAAINYSIITANSFAYFDASKNLTGTANPANGELFIGSTGAAPVKATLTGTSNQIVVANAAGSITLSTPQSIGTGSSPTFAALTLTNTTNQFVLGTTRTITISATQPASSSRTYTMPDAGANANFVLSESSQTLNGALTLTAATGNPIHGTNTNDSASAGYVGEEIRSAVGGAGAVSSTGTGQWFDITSISLTAGDWEVHGIIETTANGGTVTYMDGGISSTSGNSGTGLVNGDNQVEGPPPVAAYNASVTVSGWRVSIASTVIYYLKANMGHTVATPKAFGRISARRLR